MTSILDTNHNVTPRLPQLKAILGAGGTITRYISTNTTSEKCIKPAEARAIAGAGLRLCLVYEVYGGVGDFSHGDINGITGVYHAKFARDWAATLGAPDGACIYFAIDTDASNAEIKSLVLPYFKAIKNTLALPGDKKYAVGPYGSGAVCMAVQDAGLADYTWLSQSMGWTGSKAYRDSKRWNLLQGPVTQLAGLDTDTDISSNGPFGDFVPFSGVAVPVAPPPAPVIPHDAFWLQRRLNVLGAVPTLNVDGDIGQKTITEIEKYLPTIT